MISPAEKSLAPPIGLINKKQILIRASLLALPLTLIMLILTVLVFAAHQLNIFSQAAQISPQVLRQTLQTGWQQTPLATAEHKNLLILGLDSLSTRGNSTPLTDSMLLISLNLKNGHLTTLPLPRDLWSEAYQTKINALYTYGLERYPTQPEKFPQEVIEALTGIPIHHTVVISMTTVRDLIDLVGGIEVDVTQGFTDKQFPRTDVDVTTETDPTKLYETLEIQPGLQFMDGETVLKYMRSRHGDNEQNTDQARSNRQQEVVLALASKLTGKKTLLKPNLLGQLYKYYLDNFAHSLPPTEMVATLKTLLPLRDQIQLENTSLSVYPDDQKGVIEHPPTDLYDGQWVYVIKDQEMFKNSLQQSLLNNRLVAK